MKRITLFALSAACVAMASAGSAQMQNSGSMGNTTGQANGSMSDKGSIKSGSTGTMSDKSSMSMHHRKHHKKHYRHHRKHHTHAMAKGSSTMSAPSGTDTTGTTSGKH